MVSVGCGDVDCGGACEMVHTGYCIARNRVLRVEVDALVGRRLLQLARGHLSCQVSQGLPQPSLTTQSNDTIVRYST